MPSEVVKTRSITHKATVELTEAEVADYLIAEVKRRNPSVKDYELTCEFSVGGLTATVSGELVK